jgi:hypothetical protein
MFLALSSNNSLAAASLFSPSAKPMGSPCIEPPTIPEAPTAEEAPDIPVEQRFLVRPYVTDFGGQADAPVQTEIPI